MTGSNKFNKRVSLATCVGEVDDSQLDLAQTTGCILVSPHTPTLGSGEDVSGCQ